jgi:pyruvate formate lyase activating enzyme
VVTLLVPGFNDDAAQLAALTRFLARISPDLPWHVTAFRPTYRLQDRGATTAADLARAVAIGREAGLHFVYAGNVPGLADESTRCPGCGAVLIERHGFSVRRLALRGDGRCPGCGKGIPGIWADACVPLSPAR